MRKVYSLIILSILLLSGLQTGIAIGKETEQKTQQSQPNSQVLSYEKFEIETKYSFIRSYPGGGGIFIIQMIPKNDFLGYVSLKYDADPNLNAELDRETLDKESQIAELTIQPNKLTELITYEIVLTATYHKKTKHSSFLDWINKFPILSYIISRLFSRFVDSSETRVFNTETITLEVEMIDWSSENLQDAIIKRDELIDWLEVEHPEFGTFTGENCYAYVTYTAHLVVEHWTFLYEDWELRICYHVMVPPYDWSKLWLRERGEVDAIFAARRESDGTIYEIPIEDYPIFYGY